MKYLRYFETDEEFEEVYVPSGTTYLEPWVSLTVENGEVNYNKQYIQFEDPEVERICMANFSSDGSGVTMQDAANVISLGDVFSENTAITSFNELQYFGVSSVGYCFPRCSNLRSAVCGENVSDTHAYAFGFCPSIEYIEFKGHISNLGDQTLSSNDVGCKMVFRDNVPPENVYSTCLWGTQNLKIYVPYSQDHSVYSAYQNALSDVGASQFVIVELNPNGTIPE